MKFLQRTFTAKVNRQMTDPFRHCICYTVVHANLVLKSYQFVHYSLVHGHELLDVSKYQAYLLISYQTQLFHGTVEHF